MTRIFIRKFFFASLVPAVLLAALPGCGSEVVRGSHDPSIDNKAMSTGLDKDDIQRMLSENLNDLRNRPVVASWQKEGGTATISVLPFRNETSEHIDSPLHAMLSEAETWLVDTGAVKVVSAERRPELIEEMRLENSGGFDPGAISKFGKLLGVKYVLTGKVQSADEKKDDERRVQYFFFMQVLDVETAQILWQHKAYVTKLLR